MKKIFTGLLFAASTLPATNVFATSGPAAQPEHNVGSFLQAIAGAKPLETMSPTDARAVLTGAQASVKLDLPEAEISKRTIHEDGLSVDLTIVRPPHVKGLTPVFMFVHGGGWILGDFPTHERLVRDLVAGSGATAVFVNYTPSPEAHYPVAINQIYAATKWVAEHGKEIKVDSRHLAIAGNSVGGNMSTVVTMMAKEKGEPKIDFELLMWPVTDANFETASYNEFEQGYFLTKPMMKWMWNAYTTDAAERADIHASPLRATKVQLQGMPPTLIQTAELDVLRDEGEAYGRELDAAGVDVTVTRYDGMIHDFGLLNPISSSPTVRSAMLQGAAELRAHLAK